MAKLGWLGEFLLGIALPKALEIGAEKLTEFLDKGYEENPDLVKTAVVSLYPVIDVYVEKYVAETKTKLDDKAVEELMDALESWATKNSIELPNLDND